MSIEVKVPMLPESITEAQVAVWHKKKGDMCQEGDVVAELETDKVMLEVMATTSGVLTEIKANEGDTVKAQDILAVIDEKAELKEEKETEEEEVTREEKQEAPEEKEPKENADKPVNASPSVRREIHEKDIDANKIEGSGRGGRIQREDLSIRSEQRVKMSKIRAKIAERLVEAQHTAAMLTTFNEVNMEPVIEMRKLYQEDFQKKHEIKLGFMSFFVQAVVHALKDFPEVNASVDGEDIVYHANANIGIAVSTERGLVVPVLQQAENMGYADIELQIRDYAEKARAGKITMEDMSGGTFTITNGGVFGSLLSTPILNMPQAAILGMHTIQKRAVVEDDQIVIRPMMYIALTYDHRLIDGQQSVQFLVTVKDMLENPNKVLLDL